MDLEKSSLVGGVYQICRRIGGGGEGDVYLVRHLPTEQFRAAKIIKSEDPDRQMHELHMMKRLHHPSLPQIVDVFPWEGRVCLIMGYIRGRPLSEMKGQDMTGPQFFKIAKELAEVLIYLHFGENPVLHLDIKPSNILVKQDGHLALIDFGASVPFQRGTTVGAGFGTPGFAAPEQLQSAGASVDVRADIYGFGATMYYCLYGSILEKSMSLPEELKAGAYGKSEGRRLRRGTGAAGQRRGKPAFVRGGGWRRGAEAVLEKCLRAEPVRRYQDCKQLYRDLCRAEKRYIARRKLGGASAAAVFFLAALAFAAGSLPENSVKDTAVAAEQEYERLLERASGLGLMQALSFYEEAVQLCPEEDWGLIFLERLTEDYLFTVEEEGVLKTLLYTEILSAGETAAEVMRRQPEIYGEFSYRLGLAYWYFYQGTGGKRAAATWFTQAICSRDESEQPVQWLEVAGILADIGGYYEKLGRQDEEGKRQADFQTYWKDLKRLWQAEGLRSESVGIRRQVAMELLSCLIMGAYEVRQAGESMDTLEPVLNTLAGIVQDEQIWPDYEQREEASEQYRAAVAAVERVFADERGQEFDNEESAE